MTHHQPVGEIALRETREAASRRYADAVDEAHKQCVNLGLDVRSALCPDVAGVVRFAYGQGWAACEKRRSCPDMADLIDTAINHPGRVVDQLPGETLNHWTVRAVQHVVTHGTNSERP